MDSLLVKPDFAHAKSGDDVFSIIEGWGKVQYNTGHSLEVCFISKYPDGRIHFKHKFFGHDGFWSGDKTPPLPELFWKMPKLYLPKSISKIVKVALFRNKEGNRTPFVVTSEHDIKYLSSHPSDYELLDHKDITFNWNE